MSDIKVCLLESDLYWENPQANRDMFESKINQSDQDTDLFVLPEMFTTGFTMEPTGLYESEEGPSLEWMKNVSAEHNAAITGSIIVKDKEGFKNRMYFVKPNGEEAFYDKRHLFTYAGEDQFYKPGKDKKIVSYKGWKILLQVCFDLRFPVFSRNRIINEEPEYDLAIYVANWPKKRVYAWDTLLRARAIENLSFVVGVNRIGSDGNDVVYSGHSVAIDPIGNELIQNTSSIVQLSQSDLLDKRKRFRFLEEQDQHNIM